MTVAFDIGNVLVHCDFYNLITKISKITSLSREDSLSFLNQLHIVHDLGQVTIANELIDKFPTLSSIEIDSIIDEWNRSIIFEPKMIELLNRLYNKGINIALLSNIGVEHADLVDNFLSKEKFYEFSVKWFSCDQGVRKPDDQYYEKFLINHPEFKGCYYFDDLSSNLDTGLKFGFKSSKFALTDYFPSKVGTNLPDQMIYDQEQTIDNLELFNQRILEIEQLILQQKE